ncbi:hypothetical protein [Thiococcus pfennigii]|uniref:hypothetical protein n=1 Tax=Thiococcus pfennigii TaxID=1057 RepID=UPI00190331E0|nr:hypothetical protein [Thiococcus pfennigii]
MDTDAVDEESIWREYQRLSGLLNERKHRLWVAVESAELGREGISTAARATGLSRTTIDQGLDELGQRRPGGALRRGRVRHAGAGRKAATEKDPELLSRLEQLVEPTTPGNPESALHWTCKRTRPVVRSAQDAEASGWSAESL